MPRKKIVTVVLVSVLTLAAVVVGYLAFSAPDPAKEQLTANSASYTVAVRLQRWAAGDNTVDVEVSRRDHAPVEVDRLALEAAMPRMGHATSQLKAETVGPGRFHATGELFPMSGVWELSVRLHGKAGTELTTVTVPVSSS
ncbi:FixH family protein [Lentzea sp. NPDC054927]